MARPVVVAVNNIVIKNNAALLALLFLILCSQGILASPAPEVSRIEKLFAANNVVLLADDVKKREANSEKSGAGKPGVGKPHRYLTIFAGYRLAAAYIQNGDKKAAKPVLNNALKRAKTFADDYPDDAEGHALLAALYGLKIALRPFSALTLKGNATRSVNQALLLSPDNPRALMILAVARFQTPAVFGGSKKQASQLLEQGLNAIDSAHQQFPDYVQWGEIDLLLWQARCQQAFGNDQAVQQLLDKAFTLSPGNHWVKQAAEGAGFTFSGSE